MSDTEAVYKIMTYGLATAVVALAGTICAMAKYFANKREEIAEQYKGLMLDLNNRLDRVGDYLKEIYNREASEPKDRTEFDFKINDKKKK